MELDKISDFKVPIWTFANPKASQQSFIDFCELASNQNFFSPTKLTFPYLKPISNNGVKNAINELMKSWISGFFKIRFWLSHNKWWLHLHNWVVEKLSTWPFTFFSFKEKRLKFLRSTHIKGVTLAKRCVTLLRIWSKGSNCQLFDPGH